MDLAGAAGIDIGGTKMLAVVLAADGSVVRVDKRPTPKGGDAIVATLAAFVRSLGDTSSIGIGAAGLVTLDGVLRAAPNLVDVVELPLRARLEAELGRAVAVDNDATCATVAEWHSGAGRGASTVVLATLGTGIGGGLVIDGRVHRGHQGFAGEPGHMVVDPSGPRCVCGQRGCWERYASGAGLARLARDAAEGGRLRAVVELAGDDPEAVRGEHVMTAAAAGDPGALAVLDEFAWWTALGLVNLVNLIDPDRCILGGGIIEAAPLFLPAVNRHLAEIIYSPGNRILPPVLAAELGERAGAVGAALLGAGVAS